MNKFISLITCILIFSVGINHIIDSQNLPVTGRFAPITAKSEYSEIGDISATQFAMAAITDSIQLNDSTSRANHNLTGTTFATGISHGRTWVNADKGYFSFDLKPDSVIPNEIKCTYWGGDAGRCAFDIYVENVKVSTQRLKATSPTAYISFTYAVPLALTRHKAKVTIKFQSKTDSIAGPLYACQIATSAATTYSWPLNIHDPSSIIKCGDTYYIYGTGDGILAASSKDLVKWRTEPSPKAKWAIPSFIFTWAPKFEGTYWAPECIYMNGKYYMYYSASEWGTKNSCIGLATNNTLNPSDPAYNWVDQGLVIQSTGGSNYNAIDPAVMRDPQTGKIWLTYGSFNVAGIKVTELDSVSGKIRNTANQYSVCNQYNNGGYIGEASFMIYHSGYYYLFVNYGGCCSGVNSSYYIITGRSTSPTGPFLDKTGADLYKVGSASGGTIVMKHDDTRGYDDRFYGPGCLGYFVEKGTEYVSFHYYDPNFPFPGQPAGGPMLAIGKMKWSTDGWPSISFDFLDEGRYKIYAKSSALYWNKSGALLVQSSQSTALSQQWDVYPSSTGEYKISNASAADNYVETSGTDRNGNLQLNAFTNAVYEKFRVMKSVTNELFFYQSAGLRVMEVPSNSYTSGVQLGVWWFNDCNCQKWYATRISDIPTGINNKEDVTVISAFPNPVFDKLIIKNVKIGSKIETMDVAGRLVSTIVATDSNSELDFAGKPAGIYYIRICNENKIKTTKVIKN